MELKANPLLFDRFGNPVSSPVEKIRNSFPKKSALGLYGNIYSFPNYGAFRPRFYTLSDSSQGLDSLSRELLVRWSREMIAQLPFVSTAIRLLAQFAVGDAYDPEYVGADAKWGQEATDWLKEEFYPNCCSRGKPFDFKNLLHLESCMLDQDGDILCLYGRSRGFPKVQMIPSNRIRSVSMDSHVITDGPFSGSIESDGVVMSFGGQAVGYNVTNASNFVGPFPEQTADVILSARDSQLIFDPRYFDKHRGIPSIGPAILQSMTIQEWDSYISEKVKLEGTVALIEQTPSGEAPYEYQQTLAALNQQSTEFGTFNPSPNVHGVKIMQGPEIRYIKAEGGDLKTLGSETPANETMNFINRLETQILSTIGVPHQLVYSPDKVSGRISDAMVQVFRAAVCRRQKLLDDHGRFMIAWAVANAMKAGMISPNNKENLYRVFNLTHPKEFNINEGYVREADLREYQNGTKTLSDITAKDNRTVEQLLDQQEQEQLAFYTRAKRVSAQTGIELNTVIQGWRENIKTTPAATPPPKQDFTEETAD